VVEIPGPRVALLLSLPTPAVARAPRPAQLDAVSASGGPPISAVSGLIEVRDSPGGGLLWNLRGDGSTCVVVRWPLSTPRRGTVYARLIGETAAVATRPADQVMRGYSLGPCEREYDLLDAARSWGELRRELLRAPMPRLDQRRGSRAGS